MRVEQVARCRLDLGEAAPLEHIGQLLADELDASEHHEEAKVAEGVQLVRQQLVGLLERRGLAEIEAEPGATFDPHVHEALSHQPSDQPEGAVAAVWQRGYRLGDRVVRAVRVVVSSGPPPATEDD